MERQRKMIQWSYGLRGLFQPKWYCDSMIPGKAAFSQNLPPKIKDHHGFSVIFTNVQNGWQINQNHAEKTS